MVANNREAPEGLEAIYRAACARPSDINQHLPVLRDYASRCEHVTEFGLRWASGSTVAFLAAQPAELISWDIDPKAVTGHNVGALVQVAGRTKFQPRCGDSLKVTIEETDLLFIDSLHTWRQLRAELLRHAQTHPGGTPDSAEPRKPRVKKWIAFHDTITYGFAGEDKSQPGLRAAIHDFQKNNFPLWRVVHDSHENNGLTILQHASL